jgi:dTDP-4-dehydrorhamnose reductase
MRILVTGVTGQVGSALLDALAPAASIVAAGRKELDLARPDQIASVLDRIAADLIVNPAAYTAETGSNFLRTIVRLAREREELTHHRRSVWRPFFSED